MQTSRPSPRAWTLPLTVALLGLAFAASAAQAPAAAAGRAKAAPSAAPAEPEPAKSVFNNPANPQQGKDPFFPQSTRRLPAPPQVVSAGTTNPIVVVADLDLKGISGSANRRLAIINNRTFETGEEGEIATSVGHVRLTCKEIKDDSVRVIVNGQERILRLRPRP
jgi:hypothetical protein